MEDVTEIGTPIKQIVFNSKKFSKKVNIDCKNLNFVIAPRSWLEAVVDLSPAPWLHTSANSFPLNIDDYYEIKKKFEEKIKSEMGYDFKLTRKK